MSLPRRHQRSRARGVRMSKGVRYCGRGTIYGNPWVVHRDSLWAPPGLPWRVSCGDFHHETTFHATKREASQAAVDAYADWISRDTLDPKEWIQSLIVQHTQLVAALDARELAGLDLSCWCPLACEDGFAWPCHVDVILRLMLDPKESE